MRILIPDEIFAIAKAEMIGIQADAEWMANFRAEVQDWEPDDILYYLSLAVVLAKKAGFVENKKVS